MLIWRAVEFAWISYSCKPVDGAGRIYESRQHFMGSIGYERFT